MPKTSKKTTNIPQASVSQTDISPASVPPQSPANTTMPSKSPSVGHRPGQRPPKETAALDAPSENLAEAFPLPDALFSTKAGSTPQMLWGVPAASFRSMYPLSAEVIPPVNLPADCLALLETVRAYARESVAVAETAAELVQDAVAISVEEQPLAFLLMCAELPLTLAYLLPGKYQSLLDGVEQAVRQFLEAWFDDDGTPHCSVLAQFRLFLASFVRMRLMAERMGVFPEDLSRFFNGIVHQALCLTRPDGSQVFSTLTALNDPVAETGRKAGPSLGSKASSKAGPNAGKGTGKGASKSNQRATELLQNADAIWNPELFVAALQLDSDASDKKSGLAFLPGFSNSKAKTRTTQATTADQSDACGISDWSRIATLRHDWNGSNVTVKWNDTPDVELEISRGGTVLFSGNWTFETSFIRKGHLESGETRRLILNELETDDEPFWHVASWTEDADVAMLTLEASHPFFMVRRQILLAKKDDFVLLMDSTAPFCPMEDGKMACQMCLTPNLALQWEQNEESREIHVVRPGVKASSAVLLPLALPEWQNQGTSGSKFQLVRDSLVYACTIPGGGAFVPLFCDLSPKRSDSALTWRLLSVGEKCEDVTPDVASGFRVQIAESQWLIYRSLLPPVNRSVLGHNLNDEFLVARFTEEGTVEDLVRI